MKRQPTVADIVMMVGGAVTFLFSLFAFVGAGRRSVSAWTTELGLFPISTLVAVLGLAMAVVVALQVFAGVNLPARILTFDWKQILTSWGTIAAVLMLGYLIMDKSGLSLKIGGIFMLLGSLAMAAGAIMSILNVGNAPVGAGGGGGGQRGSVASAPQTPHGQGGYAQSTYGQQGGGFAPQPPNPPAGGSSTPPPPPPPPPSA